MQASHCTCFANLFQLFPHSPSTLEQLDQPIRAAGRDRLLKLRKRRAEEPQRFQDRRAIRQADIPPHLG